MCIVYSYRFAFYVESRETRDYEVATITTLSTRFLYAALWILTTKGTENAEKSRNLLTYTPVARPVAGTALQTVK